MYNLVIGSAVILYSLYHVYASTKAEKPERFAFLFMASLVGIMWGLGIASEAYFFMYLAMFIFGIAYVCLGALLIMVQKYLFGASILVSAGVLMYLVFV